MDIENTALKIKECKEEIGKGIITINKLTDRTNVLYNVYGRWP